MYLKQQLAAVFDQLKAKDIQLSAMHHQLQAQHAQQTQRAQHAQQAQHGRQLNQAQHFMQESRQAPAQAASEESTAGDAIGYFSASQQSAANQTSLSVTPAMILQSNLQPVLLGTSAAPSFAQPHIQTVTDSDATVSLEAAESQTPRHRFVQQRVQELQSRQSSPEKSLSLLSSRLNSPRAGLVGSAPKAGLLDAALDSNTLEPAGISPGRTGQVDGAVRMSPDRARQMGGAAGISPQYASAQITSSSLQLQTDDAQPAGRGASDPLPWCGALEVGSPGVELPCDDAFDSGSAPGEQDAAGEGSIAAAWDRVGAAVQREGSAQFGPEASAMSLPGGSPVFLSWARGGCDFEHNLVAM